MFIVISVGGIVELLPRVVRQLFRHEHLSLKVHNVKFDNSVPPDKMYIENLTSKIAMRPYNSVQMSIRC